MIGRAEFENSELSFFDSIEDCIADGPPHVVLASGSLQYLENPYGVLETLLNLEAV